MSVQRVRVGDVLRLDRIPVEPDPSREYVTVGIRSFGKGVFHYEPRPGDQLGSMRFFRLRPNRLVVSNIKGWEGAIAVTSDSDADCLASNRFLTYVPTEPERIDVGWARWYFLSEHGVGLIQRASPGSADRNRTLAIERFENLVIPLPPIEEQRRVAAHLDRALSRQRNLRSRRARATEFGLQIATSQMDSLFSEIEAPHQPLENLAEVMGGIQRTTAREAGGNPVRYLTVAHVGRDTIRVDDPRFFEVPPAELERRRLRSGDVLIIEGNGSAEQIGRAALFRGEIDPCVHQNHVIRARPDQDRLDPGFLNDYLNSPAGRRAVQAQARTSSGLRSLSVGRIKQIDIPLPTLSAQRGVVSAARRLKDGSARLDALFQRSSSLIDALEPALLNQAFADLT